MSRKKESLEQFVREMGGRLPDHFDPDRFAQLDDRLVSVPIVERAKMIAQACRDCEKDGFFTLTAIRPEGGLYRTVEHLRASEIARVKRDLTREARSRLLFAAVSEGAKARKVQLDLWRNDRSD